MKNIYKLMLVGLVCLMSSCTKELVDNVSDKAPLVLHFNFPAGTKANDAGFASGDRCGVYATEYVSDIQTPLQVSGNYINNALFTFDGASWKGTDVFWSDSKMDIYAYYPYASTNPASVDEYRFSIAKDQSAPASAGSLSGYEASDFLWACTEGVEKGVQPEPVEMTFKHKMSKLIVVLAAGENFDGNISDFTDGANMYIHNTVTEATIDLATGSVSKYIFGQPETITCRKVNEQRFEAIVVPQRLTTRRPFIELVSGDLSLLAEDIFNFKEGYVYTITLTLNKSKDQILIDIGGEVEDWN